MNRQTNGAPVAHVEEECLSCGACVRACSRNNFSFDGSRKVRLAADAGSTCILCGHCMAVCPQEGAILLSGLDGSSLRKISEPPSPEAVFNLLASRRSIRNFEDTPLATEQIEALLDAARYAPSGHNSQDYRFAVVLGRQSVGDIGRAVLRFYERILGLLDSRAGSGMVRLAAGKKTYGVLKVMESRLRQHVKAGKEHGQVHLVWDAPCLIFIHGPDRDDSKTNAILAGYNIMLAAHSMGLGTCVLGLLRGGIKHAKKEMEQAGATIPKGHAIHMILCAGVPKKAIKFLKIPPRNPPGSEFAGNPQQ